MSEAAISDGQAPEIATWEHPVEMSDNGPQIRHVSLMAPYLLARPVGVFWMRSEQSEGAERSHACWIEREEPLRYLLFRRSLACRMNVGHHCSQATGFRAVKIAFDPVQQLPPQMFSLWPQIGPITGGAKFRHHLG